MIHHPIGAKTQKRFRIRLISVFISILPTVGICMNTNYKCIYIFLNSDRSATYSAPTVRSVAGFQVCGHADACFSPITHFHKNKNQIVEVKELEQYHTQYHHDEIPRNDAVTIYHRALSYSSVSMDDLDKCLCSDCDTSTDDTIALFFRVITRVQPTATCLSTLRLAGYGIHEGGGNAHRTGELWN
jgi:hypothetical protein